MTGQKRSWLDRLLYSVQPTYVSAYTPPPRQLDDGLWIVERQLRLPPALLLPVRMTVLRLQTGTLLLHSPVKLDLVIEEWLRKLGAVAAVVAPNSFHYMFVEAYLTMFPTARFFAAPDLPERVPSLPAATVLEDRSPELWAGEIEQVVFGPIRQFTEVVFFHRPTAALILTDLAFNFTDFTSTANRVAWRFSGVPPRFGPSRSARLTLLRDKITAGSYLRRICAWPFRRILVTHGAVVETNAQEEFRRAFAPYLGRVSTTASSVT